MEENLTRRHEKNAIHAKKISIRFYINSTSPFQVFDSRGFGRHKILTIAPFPRNLKSKIRVLGLSVAYDALKLHCYLPKSRTFGG
jgi:hypothetical protein